MRELDEKTAACVLKSMLSKHKCTHVITTDMPASGCSAGPMHAYFAATSQGRTVLYFMDEVPSVSCEMPDSYEVPKNCVSSSKSPSPLEVLRDLLSIAESHDVLIAEDSLDDTVFLKKSTTLESLLVEMDLDMEDAASNACQMTSKTDQCSR